ncbi:hypothetical protein ACV229_29490 [Burkholderia sp. MR1-5-21]
MNMSIPDKLRGAEWPRVAEGSGRRSAMLVALCAAALIEAALIAAALSSHAPAPVTTHAKRVMQMRFVEVVPPSPPPPPPVVRKIVKRESEVPVRKPVPRPAAPAVPVQPLPSPAPQAPAVPLATQAAPSHTQAPSAPAAGATSAKAAATAPAQSTDIAIVCPVQVKPDMPARALAEGISGSVTARATIAGGKVIHVDIVDSTPPGVFDGSVRRAMARYQCTANGTVVVEQSFDFAEAD